MADLVLDLSSQAAMSSSSSSAYTWTTVWAAIVALLGAMPRGRLIDFLWTLPPGYRLVALSTLPRDMWTSVNMTDNTRVRPGSFRLPEVPATEIAEARRILRTTAHGLTARIAHPRADRFAPENRLPDSTRYRETWTLQAGANMLRDRVRDGRGPIDVSVVRVVYL